MRVHTKINGELSFQGWMANQLDANGDPYPGEAPVFETPFQPQIVTDSGFEAYLNGTTASRSDVWAYMAFGTGTAAATATDTTISQIGSGASARIPIYGPGYTYAVVGNELTQTIEYRSTQGQIVGVASEAGIFQTTTGGQTVMRSLIKDSGGTPTTLPLTSIDFIYARWRVKSTVNLSDVTGTIMLGEPGSEISYNWVLRPMFWTSGLTNGAPALNVFAPIAQSANPNNGFGFHSPTAYATQTLGAVTAGPGGTGFAGSLFSVAAYTAGSKQRAVTYKWNITQGNTGSGIGAVSIVNGQSTGIQMSFAATSGGARIPKDNTKEFTLTITYSFGR